jgi:hypothetical protein
MVDARIGNVATKLILDTGSTDHVLTMDLVHRAGLPHARGDDGTDAAGTAIDSWSIGAVDVSIAKVVLPLDNVVAFEGPAPFVGWGIGGFLSPQHLHPTARVVLDFVESELTAVDGDAREIAAGLADRYPHLRPVWLDPQPGDGTILVQAAVEPYHEVVTMLDSGGKTTQFADGAVPGLDRGEVVVSGSGVSGTEIAGAVAEHRTLRVGDALVAVRRLFVRPDFSDVAQGLVGMDVLAGTVLVVGAGLEHPILWLVPV